MKFYVVKVNGMYFANNNGVALPINRFVQDVIYANKWVLPDQAGHAIQEHKITDGKVYQVDTVEIEVK